MTPIYQAEAQLTLTLAELLIVRDAVMMLPVASEQVKKAGPTAYGALEKLHEAVRALFAKPAQPNAAGPNPPIEPAAACGSKEAGGHYCTPDDPCQAAAGAVGEEFGPLDVKNVSEVIRQLKKIVKGPKEWKHYNVGWSPPVDWMEALIGFLEYVRDSRTAAPGAELRIGDRVIASPDNKYRDDYRGEWFIVKIKRRVKFTDRHGELDIGVSEYFPPRNSGDITDNFYVTDWVKS